MSYILCLFEPFRTKMDIMMSQRAQIPHWQLNQSSRTIVVSSHVCKEVNRVNLCAGGCKQRVKSHV